MYYWNLEDPVTVFIDSEKKYLHCKILRLVCLNYSYCCVPDMKFEKVLVSSGIKQISNWVLNV
jgi:hypothetical protein